MPIARKWTDEAFRVAVASSFSLREVLLKLGLKPAGGNYKEFSKHAERLGVDTSHFTGQGYLKGKSHNWAPARSLDSILVEESDYTLTSGMKQRLVRVGILEQKCYECGITEWEGRPLSFHLDHINGINNDHRRENLRLLCPNCHSQTATYCGKNKRVM